MQGTLKSLAKIKKDCTKMRGDSQKKSYAYTFWIRVIVF